LGWRFRHDPTFGKASIDNGSFDVFNGDRWVGNAQNTSALARGWAYPASKFREIVGLMQTGQSVLPLVAINQIVPFRNEIRDRAAVIALAKGYTTVHAARALGRKMLRCRFTIDFLKVEQSCRRIAIGHGLATEFFKTGGFPHDAVPSLISISASLL
jgi:hypothetical protein